MEQQKINATYYLKNGVELPCVGYGSFRINGRGETAEAIRAAVSAGYRLIDTAACYNNEEGVGDGVRTCGLPREELIVASKVWNTERGYDKAMAAFDKTMERLGLEFLDLYMIHWPANAQVCEDWDALNLSTWRALREIYHSGRVRAIGVSNFRPKHLLSLMEADVQPMVNQIELHPGFWHEETLRYCHENGIVVQAWSPLGRATMFDQPALAEAAEAHGCTPAQVCLRWVLQHGALPLPKSTHRDRMRQNLDVFGFSLTGEEMRRIDVMPLCGGKGTDPDLADFY